MRGNHDCFDTVGWKADNNLYKTFGKSADLLDAGKGVYSWKLTKDFGEYNFVVADACPKKGPSRPFNFFGYFTTNTMNRLASIIIPKKYNHTFLFSHYPTTTLFTGKSSDGYNFKDLATHFSAYFCGHLHRLAAGMGDTLKSYYTSTDSLELELSDMKDHGSYRIIAVDHDLISFVDVDLPISQIPTVQNEDEIVPLTKDGRIVWPSIKIHPAPVVLITNPKESKYILPTKEPLELIRKSTHIRFLVFSEHEHTQLKIKIFVDGIRHPFSSQFVGNDSLPLWTSVWEPSDFDDFETHTISIEVTAPDGQIGTGDVSFRMDDMRVKIHGGVGEWITWMNISSLLRSLCIFAMVMMILAILAPKIYNDYEEQHLVSQATSLENRLLLYVHEIDCGIYPSIYASIHKQVYIWTHRFLQFPKTQPRAWYVCFVLLLALFDLPWFRAEFIPSGKYRHNEGMGYFYLWGLYFSDKQWIPVDTWLYAIFELTFTVGVFILYFVWKSSDLHLFQCKGLHEEKKSGPFLYTRLWFQPFVVIYLLWRAIGLVDLAWWYGGVWPTLVFNLLVWWLVAVACFLFFGKDGIVPLIKSKQNGEIIAPHLEICHACSREQ
ncbi:hypothetical protein G6F35_007490 [Rhizopus arrhizus]|nr:hypothetical protein G6F35_007490 [Rhizopus arrhizus]KAG1404901.1 hypothetical protein G6F58_010115 [Rhizopus delemar]